MKTSKACIVLVTAPNLHTARKLAKTALKAKLVACANLIPRIESHYWWGGKIDSGSEVLMLFKSTSANLRKLETLILAQHPYDTAEFISLPVGRVAKPYLSWWLRSAR